MIYLFGICTSLWHEEKTKKNEVNTKHPGTASCVSNPWTRLCGQISLPAFLDELDRSTQRLRIIFDVSGPLVPGAVPALTLSSMLPDPGCP